MGIRETLLWPVAQIAAWVDDNPLRAAGVVVAVGAVAALLVSALLGAESGTGGTTSYEAVTAETVVETALAQPAYVVVAVVGLAVFAAYDG